MRLRNSATIAVALLGSLLMASPQAHAAEGRSQLEKARQRPGAQPAGQMPGRLTPKANLSVGSVAVAPSSGQGIQQNSHVMLSIEVKNGSSTASPAGETLALQCKVVSGGPQCPVADSTQVLPAIPAGSAHQLTLVAAQGAQPGDYSVAFVLEGHRGRPRTVDLHVYPLATLTLPGKKLPIPQP